GRPRGARRVPLPRAPLAHLRRALLPPARPRAPAERRRAGAGHGFPAVDPSRPRAARAAPVPPDRRAGARLHRDRGGPRATPSDAAAPPGGRRQRQDAGGALRRPHRDRGGRSSRAHGPDGALALSPLAEPPPARTPIPTRLCRESRRHEVYARIREAAAAGHQAYIVYPLVEESEKSSLRAASTMVHELAAGPLAGLRLG